MKIRLSMSGRDSKGHVRFKRTVTEAEFVELFRLVAERDGTRPWAEPEGVKAPNPEQVVAEQEGQGRG